MTDKPRDDVLREVSSMLRRHRGPCPEVDTLIAYARGELAGGEAGAVETHLGLCPSCQELAELGDDEPEKEPLDEVTWSRAERNLDARDAPWQGREGVAWFRPRVGLATLAAGLLAVAVGAGLWLGLGVPDPSPREPVTRGSALRAIEPVGLVETVTAFRWQSPPVDLDFRVEVESRGEAVWSATARRTEISPPAELVDRLLPGRAYRWRVRGVDDAGVVVLESPWVAFELMPGG